MQYFMSCKLMPDNGIMRLSLICSHYSLVDADSQTRWLHGHSTLPSSSAGVSMTTWIQDRLIIRCSFWLLIYPVTLFLYKLESDKNLCRMFGLIQMLHALFLWHCIYAAMGPLVAKQCPSNSTWTGPRCWWAVSGPWCCAVTAEAAVIREPTCCTASRRDWACSRSRTKRTLSSTYVIN